MPCDYVFADDDEKICEKGSERGIIFPINTDWEASIPWRIRTVVYLVGLLWTFCGVTLIADVFVMSIEAITSKKRLTRLADGKERTVRVWNETVANLSLMALGSSAPEIMLNVIGVYPTFQSSDLGPGTIVGSAAFNLFIIIAVCIVAIPAGESRKINQIGVYCITAATSVGAYVWMSLVLEVWTPNQVTMFEGFSTFGLFWVLLYVAWFADTRQLCMNQGEGTRILQFRPETSPDEVAEIEFQVRKKYGQVRQLKPEETAILMHLEYPKVYSRAVHQSEATRMLFAAGDRPVFDVSDAEHFAAELLQEQQEVETTMQAMRTRGDLGDSGSGGASPLFSKGIKVGFTVPVHCVLESSGCVAVVVKAWGFFDVGKDVPPFKVAYTTRQGTAREVEDFVPATGEIEFSKDHREEVIQVEILPSSEREPSEVFYIDLLDPRVDDVCFADFRTAEVTIIDEGDVSRLSFDDDSKNLRGFGLQSAGENPGTLHFEQEVLKIPASTEDMHVKIRVLRSSGEFGKVQCSYYTESDTAIAGQDFIADEGLLTFEHKKKEASFMITVCGATENERTESFRIVIKDATGGAIFHPNADGGPDTGIMTVFIEEREEASRTFLQAVDRAFNLNWDAITVGNTSWKETCVSAFYCKGSKEAQRESSNYDFLVHLIVLPWKLFAAVVPPVEYCNGWAAFLGALLQIGVVTTFIGDLAQLLGCILDISDSITAITLVALGTSLPDCFASRSAAIMDATADNSVGNVTGSNAVNVFLGLGLPWMICSVFWFHAGCEPGDKWHDVYKDTAPEVLAANPGGAFIVVAGTLETSVRIFSGLAFVATAFLAVRRVAVNGELGGPRWFAWLSAIFMTSLWVVYIGASIYVDQCGETWPCPRGPATPEVS